MKVSNAAEDPATLDMEALGGPPRHAGGPGTAARHPAAGPRSAAGSGRPGRAARDRPRRRRRPPRPDVRRAAGPRTGSTRSTCRTRRSAAGARRRPASAGRCAASSIPPRSGRCCGTSSTPRGRASCSARSATPATARSSNACSTASRRSSCPVWPSFRAQVVHGDLTTDNALVDDAGLISGHRRLRRHEPHRARRPTSRRCSTRCSTTADGDELFRAARLVLDGYQRVTPLEPLELRLLGELLAARAAVTIAISSWRSERGLEDATFAERYNAPGRARRSRRSSTSAGTRSRGGSARTVGAVPARRPGRAARGGARTGARAAVLRRADPRRRARSGVWMTAADGRRYLDAYNNVPCVGHGHPRVAEAIARQAPPAQHEPALPARGRHRARRAAHRDDAGRLGPRHGAVRQLRLRGERPRLAAGDDVHRQRRRAVHGRSPTTAITDAIAALSPETWQARPAARPRRDVGTTRSTARDGPRRRGVRGALGELAARGPRRRRSSSTAS